MPMKPNLLLRALPGLRGEEQRASHFFPKGAKPFVTHKLAGSLVESIPQLGKLRLGKKSKEAEQGHSESAWS